MKRIKVNEGVSDPVNIANYRKVACLISILLEVIFILSLVMFLDGFYNGIEVESKYTSFLIYFALSFIAAIYWTIQFAIPSMRAILISRCFRRKAIYIQGSDIVFVGHVYKITSEMYIALSESRIELCSIEGGKIDSVRSFLVDLNDGL